MWVPDGPASQGFVPKVPAEVTAYELVSVIGTLLPVIAVVVGTVAHFRAETKARLVEMAKTRDRLAAAQASLERQRAAIDRPADIDDELTRKLWPDEKWITWADKQLGNVDPFDELVRDVVTSTIGLPPPHLGEPRRARLWLRDFMPIFAEESLEPVGYAPRVMPYDPDPES